MTSNFAVRRRTALAFALMAATSLMTLNGAANAAAVKLQFWDMIWGQPEYIKAAQAVVQEFNKEHPDIQVEYRSIPWSNWYQTFVTAVSSGSAPDISTGAGYQAVQLYKMGAIRPLDDMIDKMKADGDLKDFSPGTIDTLRFDNHYVSLPWGLDIRVWFYRPSLLKAAGVEVPETWDEFRAAAKKLTGNGKYGVIASGDTGGSHYLLASMLNNGGALFDADGKSTFASNPRNVEALDWLSSLVTDGSMHPASPGYSSDDRRAAFLKGEGAFVLDGPNTYKGAGAATDDIAVLPPLKGPHGDLGTIFWVNNIMMYKQTKNPEAAETFMRWWSQHQLPLWTEGHTSQIPARQSFIKDAVAGDKTYQYVVDHYIPIGKTTATAYKGIFPQLSEIEGEGVLQTLTQQIFQGVPVTDALPQADSRIQEIMSK
ncbi:sugar ABC transporter substrate-binding protein [Rhizobium sp. P38BS-XIX]|uniref:ABC transporter substrate-binding protein n=1 Tax=Rhizobium sp. P38BS-XIX TaxID=2726740 RepID=UPI00145756F1|nr:sugar ABC transporter substrate-binding protein [Rhizobium sp. P38BS-XIX]NLS01718.1 sugar ABC transporter substrate-binding protein [Rhizobium sp. P38BS-XIX]